MFLHRWSKLLQILRMSYCSSCRHYLLPSREISHVKWGDRFPYSILALRNRVRKVWSQQCSLTRIYLRSSPFSKELLNMTVKVCIGQFTYTIPFWSSVLEKLASMLLKPIVAYVIILYYYYHPILIPMEAYSSFSVHTTNDIHYFFVQLQITAFRLLTFGGTMARYQKEEMI